jgi:molybdopterin synthase catalytic subunit
MVFGEDGPAFGAVVVFVGKVRPEVVNGALVIGCYGICDRASAATLFKLRRDFT